MLRIPLWKKLLVWFICLLSIYLSIPTLLPQIQNNPIGKIFPNQKINLGLDLKGGSYLLLEIDFKSYDNDQFNKMVDHLKRNLRENRIAIENFTSSDKKISFKVRDLKDSEKINSLIREAGEGYFTRESSNELISLNINEEFIAKQRKELISQTIEIVRRRVDESGTKEIDLQRQGDNYILLQVPGIEDPTEIKKLLGKTAKLGFYLSEDRNNFNPASNIKIFPINDHGKFEGTTLAVQGRPILTGEMLVDAQATIANGMPVVNFKFNNLGAKLFADITSKSTGKLLAIVLDNVIISAPAIRESIPGGAGVISGSFTIQSANELALLLRAGALPVPLNIVEERSVGPSLGIDSIQSGAKAALLGLVMVIVFMFIFYYLFGLIANVALIINFFLIIAFLSLLGATLTLPGIAGIVLTLGMAVDANVLIFERIKEEATKGKTPLAAIESGYNLAFGTILDSNLTTVLAAVILYIFGAGPVKGFAVTLSIGILCSMFTAITVTKILVAMWYRRAKPTYIRL